MNDCIFCKIIAGDIPSARIYEDDDIIAFLDLTQTTKGHTLVAPKKHFRNLLAMPHEEVSLLFTKIPEIANRIIKNLGAKGMNILQNNEEIAGQTVFHTHIHLIPRYASDDGLILQFTKHNYDLQEVAKQIIG